MGTQCMHLSCHAKHRRSGVWSAANNSAPSRVMAKNSPLMSSASRSKQGGTDACIRGVFPGGISRVRDKGKGLDICYSATYMSQTRDQQRFTISEVAADWHEPMVPQRIMWPSTARANGQLDPRCRHTIVPINHTRPSPRSRSYYSFLVPLRVGG